LAAGVVPADAQEIRGTVYGAEDLPIADASVVLLDESGQIRRGTLTEPDGSYSLTAPQPGTYTVRVGGLNIETWDSQPLSLVSESSVELDVHLGGGPRLDEFDRRRAEVDGTFLTAQDFEGRAGERFTDILRQVRGVTIVPLPANSAYSTVRLAGANFGRSVGARQRNEPRDDCPPVLFVNGKWWGSLDEAGDQGPDYVLPRDNVAAVEVYTPTQVPQELRTEAEAEWCGVIVVWEKASQ
jgi:hypothetical protein